MTAPAPIPASPHASRFERLASWSQRRRWWAVALWVIVLAAVASAARAAGSDYQNDYSMPGTGSQQAPCRGRRRGSSGTGIRRRP